mgnify:CR=1 FL=1
MPAATIAALLDYETNIEDALKAHFQNTLPTTQILTPRVLIGTAPILTTPRITLVVGVAWSHQQLPPRHSAPVADGRRLRHRGPQTCG